MEYVFRGLCNLRRCQPDEGYLDPGFLGPIRLSSGMLDILCLNYYRVRPH